MADLYLTPAERYTAALGGFYYGDLPEPGTVYTQLIKDILNGTTPDKEPKNILARFIYSLYISDLGDPYPRYELAKLLYWKLHDITTTKSGSILTVTIDGKEDYMTINTDLSRLWYKVLFGSKTDTITEFPYIFNTMQTKLSDWELFSNVSVSGTPTPDDPIMPQGTGEKTVNWFDISSVIYGTWTDNSGITQSYGYGARSIDLPSSQITVSFNGSVSPYSYSIVFLNSNDEFIIRYHKSTSSQISEPQTFTPPNTAAKFYIQVANGIDASYPITKEQIESYKLMLNLGSTALPYEPYGYKIPISSANTTTPVYLGEVESTRRVKKLVLTGGAGETWYKSSTYNTYFCDDISDYAHIQANITYCSHYKGITNQSVIGNVADGELCWNYGGANRLYIHDDNITSRDDWIAYLQQQYANGTPVTVWYVLATQQTAVVNEPLMKIGDYADSMSRTQTGIDIPTIVGQNTLDVLTTVKPSSISIEYTSAEENQSRSKRISLLKSPLKKGLIK